jgi:hypothetical protein
MLYFLRDKVSERKLRLLAVACCYRVLHLMTDIRSRRAVEMTERFADGIVSAEEWIACSEKAHHAYRVLEQHANTLKAEQKFIADCGAEAACHAACAAYYVGYYPYQTFDIVGNPMTVASAVTNAVRYEEGIKQGIKLMSPGEESNGIMRAVWKAELANHVPLIHCIFGNPFRSISINHAWLTWHDGTVSKMAQSIYAERVFASLPILADALEEAGCTDASILNHCRGPGPHVRGCWVIDFLLGKK